MNLLRVLVQLLLFRLGQVPWALVAACDVDVGHFFVVVTFGLLVQAAGDRLRWVE